MYDSTKRMDVSLQSLFLYESFFYYNPLFMTVRGHSVPLIKKGHGAVLLLAFAAHRRRLHWLTHIQVTLCFTKIP